MLTQNPKNFILVLMTCILSSVFCSHYLLGNEQWPLRNGNFRNAARPGGSRPLHDWNLLLNNGKHIIEFEEYGDAGHGLKQARILTITSEKKGRGVVYQDVFLPAGRYRFAIEAKIGKDALLGLYVANAAQNYSTNEAFERVAVEFSVEKAQEVRVHLMSLSLGRIHIKEARIDILELFSAAIPAEWGNQIGAIVLSDNPTETEEYACYELQKYIEKMTGQTVGLEGRDKTYPGRRIVIKTVGPGDKGQFCNHIPADSYSIGYNRDDIILSGINDLGTLYAVYDFLKYQGCGWYWPGDDGEVVPYIDTLKSPYSKIESPDWDVRGLMNHGQKYDYSGVWYTINTDDYIDWAVRNRLNAGWFTYAHTVDFGDYRGGGRLIRTNHSHSFFWTSGGQPVEDNFAPLVNGVRKPRHGSGRWNVPCLSNSQLRERTVEFILKYFKDNPGAKVFGLNADDEPADWCQCDDCRKLDPDKGQGLWKENERGMPLIAMTDRSLDYVNYVTEKVVSVFPDKQIEIYAYGSTRKPPTRIKVHPNVLVKFCYWPSTPLGIPLEDQNVAYNLTVADSLKGWKNAGVRHFALYDYGNYRATDTASFWFYNITDSLRLFKSKWDFEHYLGENDDNFRPSMMAYNIRAEALWNKNVDYKIIIEKVCDNFYGPAGKIMNQYYSYMDNVILDFWRKEPTDRHTDSASETFDRLGVLMGDPKASYTALSLHEFQLNNLKTGLSFIKMAWEAVTGNPIYENRIAHAEFGHNYLMLVWTERAKNPTAQYPQSSRKAYERCNELRKKYHIMVNRDSVTRLKNWHFPPIISKILYEFPVEWSFKIDPDDEGDQQKWYDGKLEDCQAIRTDNFWTRQGFNYHGAAWYSIEFQIPEEKRDIKISESEQLVLYFDAVDGVADIYLDGQKIGEQKKDAGFMWDKSFVVLLPDDFDPHVNHQLSVRVEKDRAAAGIWKPVSIAVTDMVTDN